MNAPPKGYIDTNGILMTNKKKTDKNTLGRVKSTFNV